ncbi:MAG: hypothetical protein CR986_05025 [Ignavibacteriae bacterium]|nr:MAG: hypothetical protein CR986_05025 [Ignavibacteriota bacterium]
MKSIIKKVLLYAGILILIFVAFALLLDLVIMPNYVNSKEVTLPDFVGMSKTEAEDSLNALGLEAILEGPRYSDEFPIDHVIYQKPDSGSVVKERRRVYLVISGGNPLTKIPNLIGKTLRDAKVTIDRLGFQLGDVTEVESEETTNTIVEQYPKVNTNLQKGSVVKLKVSIGPRVGMVRVPDLLGLSLKEAEDILGKNSLVAGKINYQDSQNLLPNTIVAQYPAKNKLVNVGESVDLFITKNQK